MRARSGVVTTQTAAPSFCPLAFPAVTVDSGSCRIQIGLSLARPSRRRVRPRVLVGVDEHGSPRRCGTATGTISSANSPASLRGHGPLMRLQGERVLVRTADLVLRAEVLRGLHHPALHGIGAAAGGDPSAGEPVDERDGVGLDTPPQARGGELGLAHRLRATGEITSPAPVATCMQASAPPADRRRSAGRPAVRALRSRVRRRARRPDRSPGPHHSVLPDRGRRRRSGRRGARYARRAPSGDRAARTWAGTSRNTPPNRPTGVRSGSQITASGMRTSCWTTGWRNDVGGA